VAAAESAIDRALADPSMYRKLKLGGVASGSSHTASTE
jgi:hypothetical protein